MIKPLRKRDANGKLYERRSKVEKELERLDKLKLSGILNSIQNGHEKASSEAIVYLLRREVRNGTAQSSGVDGLISILTIRSELILKRHISKQFSETEQEEILNEVIDKLIDAIIDSSDKTDYAEVNFNHWLQTKRFDACKSQMKKIDRIAKLGEEIDNLSDKEPHIIRKTDCESAESSGPTPDETFLRDEAHNKASLPPQLAHAEFTVEDQCRIVAVLEEAELEPHVLEAFLLHHYWNIPIDSKFPKTHTLVKHFGKSEKTIRNWLAQADTAFTKQRGNHDEDERDEARGPGLGTA